VACATRRCGQTREYQNRGYGHAVAGDEQPRTGRTPASRSVCRSLSLSLASVLVVPLTVFRTRFPSAPYPSLGEPLTC
jgi:hypothetical protein